MILLYKTHRFSPPEIISQSVQMMLHPMGFVEHDFEDLLAERDIIVSYEAIRFLTVYAQVQNLFQVGRGHLKAVHHRLLRAGGELSPTGERQRS